MPGENRLTARYSDFRSVAAELARFQRQYQAETRRLLETVGPRYRAALTTLTSARDAARTWGSLHRCSVTCHGAVHAEFPILRDRGFEAIKLVPVTRARVLALQEELERELPRLEQQQHTLDRLVSSLAAGEQALAEGRYAAAMRMFEQIVTASPESRAAEARVSECRAILEAQKADAQRVKVLVRDAQARARSKEWEQVIVVCDQILSIDRTVPLAIALREAARSALEQQRQRAVELRLEHEVERAHSHGARIVQPGPSRRSPRGTAGVSRRRAHGGAGPARARSAERRCGAPAPRRRRRVPKRFDDEQRRCAR